MDSSEKQSIFVRFVNRYKVDLCLLFYIIYMLGKLAFKFIAEIPQIKSIFECMNVELPGVTLLLFSISDFAQEWWMVGLVPALIILFI